MTYPAKLVALGTGTGKTYIATEYSRGRPLFVVSPKSVITAWNRVITEMDRDPAIGVLNWEQLKTGRHKFWNPGNHRWNIPEGSVFVIDEIHKGASGPDSQITKMVALLKGYPLDVLMLSATPASSPLQMRAIGYLLGQHAFKEAEFYAWCRAHGAWFDRYLRRYRFPSGPAGRQHMKAINEKIKDRLLHMDIADIPGFPESLIEAKLFDLEAKYADKIATIYAEMSEEIRTGESHSNILVASLRARQKTELLKVPLLADLVSEALEEDKSPVVFVTFRSTVEELCTELIARGIPHGRIHGDQPDGERQAFIDAFQSNLVHVMVATSDAGGVGISLHDVLHERPRVSYITPSPSASSMKQCLGRIQRAGGTRSVQTFVLISGTIEEGIYRNITSKFSNIESLVDEDFSLT